MAWESATGYARLLAHAAGVAARRAVVAVEAGPFARWRWPGPTPERLVIAPQDIRTADPTLAADIYAGLFAFAGKVVETGGRSPFEVREASDDWMRVLHGFTWLRHLRAADGALTRQNARALVADWIAQEAKAPPLAFEAEVLAHRVLAWITQSPLILEDADRSFYRRFLRSLTRQLRRLRTRYLDAQEGWPRLLSAIAVAEAALSLDGQQRLVRQATHRLDQELSDQVLSDGGHVSRNPGILLEILTELLPLRQAYTARGLTPSNTLIGAIDRMMPMLRFFRHSDGAFAHFNGMGSTPADQLATVLAYDDVRGRPVQDASYSGYQRLEAGGTLVLMDVGGPPPLALSAGAHAGFLSFEMSGAAHRFIVNCGVAEGDERWRQIARATPAHSTLTVEETSSASFLTQPALRRRLGPLLVSGPSSVTARRTEGPAGIEVVARHDGYSRRFGLIHERQIVLNADGSVLTGLDRLITRSGGADGRRRFDIRFHLHPAVRANRTAGGDILLLSPDGEAWTFSCPLIEPVLAESIYLSDVHGRRRSAQIVLSGGARVTPEVGWTLTRTGLSNRVRGGRARAGQVGPDLFG
ncbi:heparinase II/III family protein [Chthonobacter rhizosphaerae]|uniref:heparinase II/III family protein n=1 Tax=Chthonobacter rhizosphaerae TaxID=2735553 RepID=UPI0015EF1F2C|nr:heparinase II/III family protein [Chthonobacter rhizosphaerae]